MVKQPIQMQLSKKQKTFSLFYSTFLKSKIKFEQFEKKDDVQADVFRKLQTVKDVARQMPKKSCFKRTFEK